MKKLSIIFQLLICLVLTSCRSFYTEHSNDIQLIPIFQIPKGTFSDVAWANQNTIIVNVNRDNVYNNNKMCVDEDLVILNTKTGDSQKIDLQLKDECEIYSVSNLQLLPNQTIGYLFDLTNTGIMKSALYKIEISKDMYRIFIDREVDDIHQFSYSPDMKEIIATRVKGIEESKIFLLKENGDEIDVSLDFVRAKSATWSKNNVIAFFGTKTFEEKKEPFIQFYSFEKYLFYPWQIYLYNSVTTEITEIPIEIVGPGELKWSPDGQSLAFRGELRGIKGVWIISNLGDTDNLSITRIIDTESTFDFSPDGNSIVFAYIGLQNTDKQNILYTINLPE